MKLEDVQNKANSVDNTITVTLSDDEAAFIEKHNINVSKLFTMAIHEIQQGEVERKLGNTKLQTPEEYMSEVNEKENNAKYKFMYRTRKSGFNNSYKAWSDEEKQELIQLYRKGTPVETIAVMLDRTIESVKTQIKYLRRKYTTVETANILRRAKRAKNKKYENSNTAWTKEEEQKMLELYSKGYGVKRICAILGRSHGSVTTRKWLVTNDQARSYR